MLIVYDTVTDSIIRILRFHEFREEKNNQDSRREREDCGGMSQEGIGLEVILKGMGVESPVLVPHLLTD